MIPQKKKISIFILKTLIHNNIGNLSWAMKQKKKNTVRKNRSQIIFIDDITEYVEKKIYYNMTKNSKFSYISVQQI